MSRGWSLFAVVAMGLAACAGLLGVRSSSRAGFPHRSHVLAGISCVSCHAGVERDDGTAMHLPSDASCATCHASAHSDTRREQSCVGCHAVGRERAELNRRYLRFSHANHTDPAGGNCVRCHTGIAEEGRNLAAPMASCRSCHEHQASLDVRECDSCHVDLPAEAAMPLDHVVHNQGFGLRHGDAAASGRELCATCHTESSCLACHGVSVAPMSRLPIFEDHPERAVHSGGFAARHADEARADQALCTTCHAPSSCQSCHDSFGVGATSRTSRNPHPAGWVGLRNDHGRAAHQDPVLCASCHSGEGEALCVGCHREGAVGGNPHPPGWSSEKPLSQAPCRACHTDSR